MTQWTFYPAFVGTFISIVGWCYFVYYEHNKVNLKTLSELGAASRSTLTYFRAILWVCGPLFAITMFFFVLPRINHAYFQVVAYGITFVCEILLGVFPAISKTRRLHAVLAFLMAAGMLAMAYLFSFSFHGAYMRVQVLLALMMSILALSTLLNRKNFIFYELPFIFLAHVTILITALALK